MHYETIYTPIKVSERLPEYNKEVNGILQGKAALVKNTKLVKGYVTANGNLEPENLVEWLEKKENVYIFTKEELDERDNQKWVSVEERLPVIWGDFLVCTGNWVGSCHYDGKFYDYSVSKMRAESRYELPVKFWQPLPNPPKSHQ